MMNWGINRLNHHDFEIEGTLIMKNYLIGRIVFLMLIVVVFLVSGCQKSEPIKIGVVATLTGENSKLSKSGINGLDIAIDEINQSGGIDGRQIELIIKDTEDSSEIAIKADAELIEDNVRIIIGPFTSGMVTRTIEFINSKDILVLGPTASVDTLEEKDDHYIRFIGSALNEAIALSDAAIKNEHKKFAVIYDMTNVGFADKLAQDFKREIEAKENGTARLLAIDPQKDETLETALSRVRELKPQAVLLVTNAKTSVTLAEKIKALNPDLQLYNSMWADTSELIKFGGDFVEGMIVVNGKSVDGDTEAYKEFNKTYIERYGESPDFSAIYSYDAMKALIKAISESKSLEPKIVKTKLLEISKYEGLQGLYSIDAYGDVNRDYHTFRIIDGMLEELK